MTARLLPSSYLDNLGGTQNHKKFRVKKPRANLEHKFQVALVSAARRANPRIILRAIPNGGARNVIVATKLKAEGVTRGTPDLFCLIPGVGVGFLELKAPRGKLTPEQETFRDQCEACGVPWAVAPDFDTAWGVLAGWGVVPSEVRR